MTDTDPNMGEPCTLGEGKCPAWETPHRKHGPRTKTYLPLYIQVDPPPDPIDPEVLEAAMAARAEIEGEA